MAMSIAASAAASSRRSSSSNVATYASMSSSWVASGRSVNGLMDMRPSFLQWMPSLPVRLISAGSCHFARIQLLGFLDVAVRANDLLVRSKEKEDAGDVCAANPKLHDRRRALDGCSQWRPMIVATLELPQTRGDQLVQGVVLAPE